jgi:hypothetical protein
MLCAMSTDESLPGDLRGQLRRRLKRLPLHSVRSQIDWAALQRSERRAASRLSTKHGLGRSQRQEVISGHEDEVRRRIIAAHPWITSAYPSPVWTTPLLYPLHSWITNRLYDLKTVWFGVRYR